MYVDRSNKCVLCADSFNDVSGLLCQCSIGWAHFNCIDSCFKHKSDGFGRQCEINLQANRSYLVMKHYCTNTGYCLGECVTIIFVILNILKAMINDCRVQKRIWLVKTIAVQSFFISSTLLCGFSLVLVNSKNELFK